MYKYFCVSNLSTDMEDVLFARLQMAVSLGFHIIFACIGMTMPFLMATAEYKYNKTGQPVYLELAKAWSKGVAIFFAVGAVSGTVLSFELGLLFPTFMEHAGPIFGMPFSWEGTAFFLEAIALGLFLYGWKRLNKWLHWFVGIVVGISGVASGIFVVAANAWMNSPAGFDWDPITQQASNIDPWAAMFNDAWFSQALHMALAAFVATGFAVAGIHAILLLKDKTNVFHQKAFKIAAVWGGIFAIMMPLSGDYSAKDVAKRQPVKLAAMEAHFHTEAPADLIIGGIPNEQTETVDFAIRIPRALSFLAYGNFDAEVKGLNEFPRENWPPVAITHYAFQIMVGIGSLLMIIALIYFYLLWRKRDKIYNNKFLKLFAIATPLGFIAVEAGWTVTEVGRQPWIIYGIMRTADSVTPMPGLIVPFILFTVLYLFLSVVVIWLLKRQIKAVEIKFKNNPKGITT